ncbi:MAG: hypothetical protein U0263_07065 [Polyangiaceae bacterium]
MSVPSRPSLPSEPSLRRLGVGGGGGGGGDRPFRAQLVVALVVGLVFLAVPLYLWRRPSGNEQRPGMRVRSPTRAPSPGFRRARTGHDRRGRSERPGEARDSAAGEVRRFRARWARRQLV